MARFNKNVNPSAANDVTGWTGFAATVSRATGLSGPPRSTGGSIPAPTGAYSVAMSSARATVAPSTTWTGVAWLHTTVARTVRMSLTVWSGTTIGDIKQFIDTSLAAATWTQVRVRGPLGTGTFDGLSAHLDLPTSAASSGTLTMSSVRLEQVDDSALAYADGATSGWVWDGTAGNSTSQEGAGPPPGQFLPFFGV